MARAFPPLVMTGAGAHAAADQSSKVEELRRQLETLTAYGGYVGYQHWWFEALRSTFVAGGAKLDSEYLSGNIVWSPVSRVNAGAELLYGRRENRNGADGDALRLQLSTQFLF